MIGREPIEIWHDSLEDGQRRVERSAKVLATTGDDLPVPEAVAPQRG